MQNLEELIKDITLNKENTKYMDVIKSEYPYLLGILKNDNMMFNTDINKINKLDVALKKSDNYCPCVITKSEDTLCPCKKMREENKCICGLYITKSSSL